MTSSGHSKARGLDLFLIAGEESGDQLGGPLMAALRTAFAAGEYAGELRFRGVGGPAMTMQGLDSLFSMHDISVMGFLPVIANLRRLLARIRTTADAIIADPPDALIIIDSPDFTHRVARRVRKHLPHLPVIDYVSPSVWAWRPGRARAMRAYVDHVLALLPFEPAAHAELGGPACSYVGHPLVERLHELRGDARREGVPGAEPPVLLVLPGSRRAEVARLLDVFGDTAARLAADVPGLKVVIPAVARLHDEIAARTKDWSVPPAIITGEAEKFAAMRRARAALAASGTVTLELALAGVPMAIAYKVSRIEEAIARRLIRTSHIGLPNIILGEAAIPEFLQSDANPEMLARALRPLLADTPQRQAQVAALRRLDALMQLPGGEKPAARAAQVVLQVLAGRCGSAP